MKTLEFIKEALKYVDYVGIQEEGCLGEKDKQTFLYLYGMSLNYKKGGIENDLVVGGDHYDLYAQINLKEKNDYAVFASNMMDNEKEEWFIRDLDDLCTYYAGTPVEDR